MRISSILIIISLFLFFSCNSGFSKPRYAKRALFFKHEWKRKKIIVIRLGSYRNPLVKKEMKRRMLWQRTLNLDKW